MLIVVVFGFEVEDVMAVVNEGKVGKVGIVYTRRYLKAIMHL